MRQLDNDSAKFKQKTNNTFTLPLKLYQPLI